MVYENIDDNITRKETARRILRRNMELVAAAGAAGALASWYTLRAGFPALDPAVPAEIAGFLGLLLVGGALVQRARPRPAVVEALAAKLPTTGRRMLSRPAVAGMALLSLLFAGALGRAMVPAQPARGDLPSPPLAWHPLVLLSGTLSLEVSGEVTEESQTLPTPLGPIAFHKAQAINLRPGGFVTFVVQWFDAPRDYADVEKGYDGVRASELQTSGATLIDEDHIQWLGHDARQVRSRLGRGTSVARYVIIGRRLYTGKVLFEGAPEPGDDIARFYSSWQVRE